MKSKVISVRVPVQFAKELSSFCKQNKMSTSEYMQKGFQKVGMMDLEEIRIEPSTAEMLTTLGVGSSVGLLSYKGVYGLLKRKGYTDQDAEMYAIISGIACGILSGYGVDKFIKTVK